MSSRRLLSIDALRGAAALAVVLYHAVQGAPYDLSALPKSAGDVLVLVLSFGFAGVWLFFIISGFCIHLRWATEKVNNRAPSISFLGFWKRRIRRLYPPYLIALVLYLLGLAVIGKLALTNFFVYDLGMHLAMLHNLDPRTAYSMNGVFWTLAIEEQLYLAYFLLLKLRVRFGWVITLVICLAVRVGWYAFCFGMHRLFLLEMPLETFFAGYWIVWALGAVSIESALGLIKLPSWTYKPSLAVIFLLVAIAITYADGLGDPYSFYHDIVKLVIHPIWGLGFFILANWIVQRERLWQQVKRVPRVIVSLAAVGLFSYSLYLTHELIFDYVAPLLPQWNIASIRPEVLLGLAPLCVIFAWVFFQFFEKPFLNSKPKSSLTMTPVTE